MKYIKIVILIICFLTISKIYSQDKLFQVVKGSDKVNSEFLELKLNESVLQKMISKNEQEIELLVPIEKNRRIALQFKRHKLFSPHYKLVNANNQTVDYGNDLLFYRSYGNKSYRAQMTLRQGETMLSIDATDTQYEIVKSNNKSTYLLKASKEINSGAQCETAEDYQQLESHGINQNLREPNGNQKANTGDVDVYLVCDYATYLDNNSSMSQTQAYATTQFNAVANVYDDFGINLNLSQLKIWDHQDPYGVDTESMLYVLSNFQCENGSGIPGNIGHLITTKSTIGGGRAAPDYSCSGYYVNLGVTKVQAGSSNTNYILAHEIGHQLSSPHTHACKWNGDNTAIDGCANIEGNCADPGTPAVGTVMSYCGNLDLTDPFHPQVKAKMVDYVNNCMTMYAPPSCGAILAENFSVDILSNTSVRVTIDYPSTNFLLGWRPTGTISWTYNSPYAWHPNTFTVTGLLPDTQYEFISTAECIGGRSSGWSCPDNYFTTNSDNCTSSHMTLTNSHLRGQVQDNTNYEASGIIQSNQMINTNVILDYDSGSEIELLPAFEIQNGATFRAIIDGCGGSF